MWSLLLCVSMMLQGWLIATHCHLFVDRLSLSDARIRLIAEGATIRYNNADVEIEFQPNTDLSFLADIRLEEVGNLRSIAAVQCTSVDVLLRNVETETAISHLDFSLSDVHDLGKIASIAPSLEYLDVTGTSVEDFAGLRDLSALKLLKANYTRLDDPNVLYLLKLPNLETVDFSNTEVTHNCVETLSTMSALKSIAIRGKIIDESNFAVLKSLRPGTEVILSYCHPIVGEWSECGLSKEAIDELRSVGLQIRGAPSGAQKCRAVLEIEPGTSKTAMLTWQQLMKYSDAEAASAIQLDLSKLSIDDRMLHELLRFSNITHLQLAGARITDSSWGTICQFTRLEVLDVSDTRVSDSGIIENAVTFESVQRLLADKTRIVGTAITEGTFPALTFITLVRSDPYWPKVQFFPACTTPGLRAILRHPRLSSVAVTWNNSLDPVDVKFMIQEAPKSLRIQFFGGSQSQVELGQLGAPTMGEFGPTFVFWGGGLRDGMP